MSKFKILVGILAVMILSLAACSANQAVDNMMADEMSEAMVDNAESGDGMMDDTGSDTGSDAGSDAGNDAGMENSSQDGMDTSQDDGMMEESDEMAGDMAATWVDYQFTDAATGESFSISGYKGKVVLVETMAMWCSNCFKQQTQVKELHSLLGERDDFIGIGIDVDPNEEQLRLASYVDKNGFDWLYSIAPAEVLAGIQADLGGQFLNPPSTPIVIFDKEGQPHPLPFGIKSASELLSFVEQFLN